MVHEVAGTHYPLVNLILFPLPVNILNCCFQTVVTLDPDIPVKYFA